MSLSGTDFEAEGTIDGERILLFEGNSYDITVTFTYTLGTSSEKQKLIANGTITIPIGEDGAFSNVSVDVLTYETGVSNCRVSFDLYIDGFTVESLDQADFVLVCTDSDGNEQNYSLNGLLLGKTWSETDYVYSVSVSGIVTDSTGTAQSFAAGSYSYYIKATVPDKYTAYMGVVISNTGEFTV